MRSPAEPSKMPTLWVPGAPVLVMDAYMESIEGIEGSEAVHAGVISQQFCSRVQGKDRKKKHLARRLIAAHQSTPCAPLSDVV